MAPLVSVIIPVYNAEKTLNRCVNSILSNTYHNIEVILVDDGSEDNSAAICQEYLKKDSRIRYIHQENKGVAGARNVGLDLCQGDYIAFVDSDDYIECEMYETMLGYAAKEKDAVIVCQWRELTEQQYPIIGRQSSVHFSHLLFAGEYENVVVCSLWNKLYPRELIKGLRFVGGMSEDEDFNDRIFAQDISVFVIPNRFYHYCYNGESLTNRQFSGKRIHFLDVLLQRLKLFNNDTFMQRETEKLYCNIFVEYYYQCLDNGIKMPKKYYNSFEKVLYKSWKNKYCNPKFYIRMVIFQISPKLYRFLAKG